MGRDDWMYDEDALEEDDESKKPPSTERQCPNCQRYVAVEAPYCPWCCKPFPEEKPRRRRD